MALKFSLSGLTHANRVKYEFGFKDSRKSKVIVKAICKHIDKIDKFQVPCKTKLSTLSRYGITLNPIFMACKTLPMDKSP